MEESAWRSVGRDRAAPRPRGVSRDTGTYIAGLLGVCGRGRDIGGELALLLSDQGICRGRAIQSTVVMNSNS